MLNFRKATCSLLLQPFSEWPATAHPRSMLPETVAASTQALNLRFQGALSRDLVRETRHWEGINSMLRARVTLHCSFAYQSCLTAIEMQPSLKHITCSHCQGCNGSSETMCPELMAVYWQFLSWLVGLTMKRAS